MNGELMSKVAERALQLGVPLTAHIDITYRCNEKCVHCYLEHESPGEMTTDEIKRVIGEMAEVGTFFLVFSGGEIFLRRDLFELIEYARNLMFAVKLKTNAVLLNRERAQRLAKLGIHEVQISLYSHRAEVHDAITKLNRSHELTVRGIRNLREAGIRVTIANVVMRENQDDLAGVVELARELGCGYSLDPTVTPKIDGDRAVLGHRIEVEKLTEVLADQTLDSDDAPSCEPDRDAASEFSDLVPCSAGHSLVYVNPWGQVFPCVQFPLPCGDLREQSFGSIWSDSAALNEVRSIRIPDLPVCGSCSLQKNCTRCPGLAYMEGNMRGPSSADCEKSMIKAGLVQVSAPAVQSKPVAEGLVQIRM